MALKARDQFETFKKFLKGKAFDLDSPVFPQVIKFIRTVPVEFGIRDITELRAIICRTFGLTDQELTMAIAGVEIKSEDQIVQEGVLTTASYEKELWDIIPKGGFVEDYCKYTARSEAPLIYHLFCGLFAVGACVKRNVWLDMGHYFLYPPLAVMILGPSGVKKTSAANIAISLLREGEYCTMYSEKITPEALVKSVEKDGCGLLFAPELTVFLGRQKYMEGIVPLITRMLDHPNSLPVETKGEGIKNLLELAPSMLSCSTLDWLIDNTPEDTFGGGFMARNIVVVCDASPRIEPMPPTPSLELRHKLLSTLGEVLLIKGEMKMSEAADREYDLWYRTSKKKWAHPEIELLGTFYQRRADMVKRVAMCLHLSTHFNLSLCIQCFQDAVTLLDWAEQFLIPTLQKMFKTTSGKDHEYVLKTIRSHGGIIEHSTLVRRVQYRLNAAQLKNVLNSLKEARQIEERDDKVQHSYLLVT